MLGAVLAHAAARPPLGFLSGQVLDGRRRLSVNGAELIFGLDYALEAVRMARG
jgi:hypothetical protein